MFASPLVLIISWSRDINDSRSSASQMFIFNSILTEELSCGNKSDISSSEVTQRQHPNENIVFLSSCVCSALFVRIYVDDTWKSSYNRLKGHWTTMVWRGASRNNVKTTGRPQGRDKERAALFRRNDGGCSASVQYALLKGYSPKWANLSYIRRYSAICGRSRRCSEIAIAIDCN